MKTKHFLTGTFSMGLIVLISNACLAFAVIHTSIQYNAGYTAACNDSKHMFIWDNDGSIWDGFDQNRSLQNNTQWMQGHRDGAICNDKHTPEFNTGFAVGCHDKQAGLLNRDALLLFRFFLMVPRSNV